MIKELEKTEVTTIFYTLTELQSISKLNVRQLHNRVKEVYASIHDKTLIAKKCNQWFIHYSILDLFGRVRAPKQNLTKPEYQTEVTINLPEAYDKKYYEYIVNQFVQTNLQKLGYSIETNSAGKPHLHIATSQTVPEAREVLKELETDILLDLSKKDTLHIQKIRDVSKYLNYISKEVRPEQLETYQNLSYQ